MNPRVISYKLPRGQAIKRTVATFDQCLLVLTGAVKVELQGHMYHFDEGEVTLLRAHFPYSILAAEGGAEIMTISHPVFKATPLAGGVLVS